MTLRYSVLTIFYTVDGSVPTAGSSIYSGPIAVSSTTTINARAVVNGFTASDVATATYTITPAVQPAAPTFSPAPGSYSSVQLVTMTAAPGAAIHYTTDGSEPTLSSPVYDAPIMLMYGATFKAVAVASGAAPSAVATGTYTLTWPNEAATPTFSPPPGTYTTPQSVTLGCATPGVKIYYETNGFLPDFYSHEYTGPITVSSTTTFQAVAWGYPTYGWSKLAIGTYSIEPGSACTDGNTRACCTGPPLTLGVGTCHGGQQTCVGGLWGACAGEQVPVAELCDSQDDDCNGVPDDGPFGVRDGNPACASTVLANAPMSGDSGTATVRLSGYGEQWFSQTFTEDDGASRDLTGTIRLVAPFGCDFDLFVYCDGCGGGSAGASLPDYYGHTTYVRAADRGTADDTFTVVIEVRYVSCAPGSIPGSQVCGNWTLDISGNTAAAASAPVCP